MTQYNNRTSTAHDGDMPSRPRVEANYVCRSLNEFVSRVNRLAKLISPMSRVIFLTGELGAGKTTFAREWLKTNGVTGAVKSPSFSMVESYDDTRVGTIHHLDLYRVNHEDEIRCLGLDEYLDDYLIIEWPEKGVSQIIESDLSVDIRVEKDNRIVTLQGSTSVADGLKQFAIELKDPDYR